MKLYQIQNPWKRGYIKCKSVNDKIEDYKRVLREGIIGSKMTFKVEEGINYPDWIWTYGLTYVVFSKRILDLFRQNEISGWDSYKVSILDKSNLENDSYEGLIIKGQCGEIDYNKENIIEKTLSATLPPFKYYKGYKLDINKWDGSDIFMPPVTLQMFVSERVRDILMKAKATNFQIDDINEKLIPF